MARYARRAGARRPSAARSRSRVARRPAVRRGGGRSYSRGASSPVIRLVIQTGGDQAIGAPATLAPPVEKPKGKSRF